MAMFGKLEFYIVNPATGLPVPSASVEIRKQGATVSGVVDAQTYNVNAPGGVTASSETVSVYQPGGAVRDANGRGVSTVSATQVVVAVPGFTGVVDDDRLSPSTNLPTIYEDAEGVEAKANPLSTDANGYAYCWVPINFYDAKVTKAGVLTERLLIDQAAMGTGKQESWAFGTGTQVVYSYDTLRTLASGDKIASWLQGCADILFIDKDGKFQTADRIRISAGGLLVDTGGVTITAGGETITAGNLTLTAGNLVFGAASGKIIPGATQLAIRNAADSADNLVITNAGRATLAQDFFARRLGAQSGTALVAGDFALSAGWGTTATVSAIETGARDSRGGIQITSSGTGQAANPTVTFTFKDGGFLSNAFGVAVSGDDTSVKTASDFWYVRGPFVSSVVFTYGGTPVAGRIYELIWMILN